MRSFSPPIRPTLLPSRSPLQPAVSGSRSSGGANPWLGYLLAAVVGLPGTGWQPGTASGQPLVTHEDAARLGLERAWFAMAPVDPQRSTVSSWLVYFDRLYAVTSSGMLASIDAETGATVWTARVGKPGYPAFGPGANERYLGAVSGDRLYLFDRYDGHLIWSRELGSAPATGPALTDRYAYVALMNGQIEAYLISSPETQPWYYQSKGRTFYRPTTTGTVVSWPTDSGLLYVCRASPPRVLFRLETDAEIVTSPSEKAPYLYIASLDGYLYCIDELTGREHWKFSTGRPITSSPAVVGDVAYVASTEPALHAVSIETGLEMWHVPGAAHFCSASDERVYAIDWHNHLLALDAKTGAIEGRLPLGENVTALVNDQTDRVFLVTSQGLVQCFHEIGRDEPISYRDPIPAVDDPVEEADLTDPLTDDAGLRRSGAQGSTAPDQEDASPFGADAPPADDASQDLMDEENADAPNPVENPFGDFGF
jgi:outer membrane protein assembly factor BamB